jgi:signal transduction histidine kinase
MSDSPSEPSLAELVAVMAHDLNNPLAALVTNLSFIEGSVAPKEGGDLAEALGDALMLCDMLRRLVGNLDLLARREALSGGASILDLGHLLRQAAERLRRQADAAEIVLEVDPAPPLGEILVQCDRELLGRAIDNLIAYGLEQAPSRSRITVTAARVPQGGHVVVEHRRKPQIGQMTEAPPPMTRAEQRRRTQALYGRGAALLCARIAADLIGGKLEVATDAGPVARLVLLAPPAEP